MGAWWFLSTSARRCPASRFLASQFIEDMIETRKRDFPELTVLVEPRARLGQALRFEPAGSALRVAVPRNQPGLLQHLQVFGDRRLSHVERLGELVDSGLAERQPGEDGPPRRVRQRREGG